MPSRGLRPLAQNSSKTDDLSAIVNSLGLFEKDIKKWMEDLRELWRLKLSSWNTGTCMSG